MMGNVPVHIWLAVSSTFVSQAMAGVWPAVDE